MSDDWDRTVRTSPPGAGPRRRPPVSSRKARERREERRRRERNRQIRNVSALLVVCALLGWGTWVGTGWAIDNFGPKDYGAGERSDTTVDVRVKDGFGGWEIGQALVKAGVVKTAEGFVNALSASAGDEIQPGTWTLFKKMTSADVVTALRNRDDKCADIAPPCRLVYKVTIPEGFITLQIYQRLESQTGVPVADFQTAAEDPVALGVSADWFANRADGKEVIKSVEGFLWPATYEFDGLMTATEMLKVMVKTFNEKTKDLGFAEKAAAIGVTPYEVLIAASIAEAEAIFDEDYPKVARVLYNRVKLSFTCYDVVHKQDVPHCLGLDSTVNYWLRATGREPLDSRALDLATLYDLSNPYNTRTFGGFPPGAISNPGLKTIQGALAPATSSNVYFLSYTKDGHIWYAANDREFCQGVQKAIDNDVLDQSDLPSGC